MTHVLKQGFIGQETEVVSSSNGSLIGIKGKIIDETKKTMLIDTGKEQKRVVKDQITFRIGNHLVEGKMVVKHPKERIKMKTR